MSSPTPEFWRSAGNALIIFALLFGFGSCGALLNWHDPAHREGTK